MTAIPRDKFVATESLRNHFVTSFKVAAAEDAKVVLSSLNSEQPTIIKTPEGHAKVSFQTDLAVDDYLTVYRQTNNDSFDKYVEGQPLRAASLNAEHERMSMLLEEMQMRVGDSFHKPVGDDSNELTLPSSEERAGKLLAFDQAGDVTLLQDGFTAADEMTTAFETAKQAIETLTLPLETAALADGAVTQEKIDPAVELGGPSLGKSSIIRVNKSYVLEDLTLEADQNGFSAGPLDIKSYNELKYSGDLGNAVWSNQDNALAVNDFSLTTPMGSQTVQAISVFSDGTFARKISQSFTADTSFKNTVSVYAKAREVDQPTFILRDGNGVLTSAAFNLFAGSFSKISGDDADIAMESQGDGWWRLSLRGLPTTTSAFFEISVLDGQGATAGDGLYVWGAQATSCPELVDYRESQAAVVGPVLTINGEWSIV